MCRHDWKTPIESFNGDKPDVFYFRIFGTRAYICMFGCHPNNNKTSCLLNQKKWPSLCYSSSTSSRYLSLFRLTSHPYALWYVFLWLGTYSYSFEFFELFVYWTLTCAVLIPLLPDGVLPIDSFVLTLISDSLVFRPILSYRTRTSYYSLILPCSMEFYAYASPSISRQLHVL